MLLRVLTVSFMSCSRWGSWCLLLSCVVKFAIELGPEPCLAVGRQSPVGLPALSLLWGVSYCA